MIHDECMLPPDKLQLLTYKVSTVYIDLQFASKDIVKKKKDTNHNKSFFISIADVPFVPELARNSPCSSTMPIRTQAGLFGWRGSPNGST